MRRHLVLAKVPKSTHEFTASTVFGDVVTEETIRRSSLAAMVNSVLDMAAAEKLDLTISTRDRDVVIPPLIDPEQLVSYAPGSSIYVLCPEGNGNDFAAVIWRTPTNTLSSSGKKSRVVMRDITAGLRRLIDGDGGVDDLRRRGHVEREFCIRRDWVAASILPGSFPPPQAPPVTPGAAESWARHVAAQRYRPSPRS